MAVFTLESVENLSNHKNNFADRVEMLLSSRGCTKTWLADELGVSRQALNHTLKHGQKPKFVSEIALIFNVNPKWLETGEGKAHTQSEQLLASIPVYNFSEIQSANSLKNLTPLEKIFLKIENEHEYFAIQFCNYPSMSSNFSENSILIFDKNLQPHPASFVLAHINGEGIFFRQFYTENKKIILKPTDSVFKTITCDQCDIFGVLIETRIKF